MNPGEIPFYGDLPKAKRPLKKKNQHCEEENVTRNGHKGDDKIDEQMA